MDHDRGPPCCLRSIRYTGEGNQCLFTPPGRAVTFLDPLGSRQGRGCGCLDQQLGFAYLETAGRSRVLGCHRAQPDGWEGTHPLPSYWHAQRLVLMEKTPARLRATLWASVMAASAAALCLVHRTVAPLESKDKQMAASSSLSSWEGCCWNSLLGKGN